MKKYLLPEPDDFTNHSPRTPDELYDVNHENDEDDVAVPLPAEWFDDSPVEWWDKRDSEWDDIDNDSLGGIHPSAAPRGGPREGPRRGGRLAKSLPIDTLLLV